ncbi:hypothetical protein DLJ53_18695 [Acuticoccus sediminis]|uniref:Uncharacterized protein n=1 Tax=Acuticoccus sediminis TaxID=2184697 RepID=A0A8B2NRQ3_9HYPH|nr:hypothetical protein [Acuticoccus sediminis]RAH99791.1 hypothetical protein DLJ53_18695 [Acuticoccus sediminis]
MHSRTTLLLSLGSLLCAGGASAGPVTDSAMTYEAASRTAESITGPVTLSQSSIAFGNGASVALKLVEDGVGGSWDGLDGSGPGQIFELAGDPGALLNGNTLCGPGTASYLVASAATRYGMKTLTLAVFQGDTVPTGADGADLCGTYGYDADDPRPAR